MNGYKSGDLIVREHKITLDEQEFVVTGCAADDKVKFYSTWPKYTRRCEKLLDDHPDEVKLIKRDHYGVTIVTPIKWFRFLSVPHVISDEVKAAMSERMVAYRNAKKEVQTE
jgi:hypothetical protein